MHIFDLHRWTDGISLTLPFFKTWYARNRPTDPNRISDENCPLFCFTENQNSLRRWSTDMLYFPDRNDHTFSAHAHPIGRCYQSQLPQPISVVRTSLLTVNTHLANSRLSTCVSHGRRGNTDFSFAVENWKQQMENILKVFSLPFSLQRSFVSYGSKFIASKVPQ